MGIRAWAENLPGQEGLDGWFTALCFDRAVTYLGVWVQNRLEARDPETHEQLYTLEGLLGDDPLALGGDGSGLEGLKALAARGMAGIRVIRAGGQ